MAGLTGPLACPLGPIPLAARGLAAVLARVGPGGRTGSPGNAGRRGRASLPHAAALEQETRTSVAGAARHGPGSS
ncbi:MAG: hypothetical protein ACREYC_01195, partial [Gammaproteobacteria bacterium]